MKPADLGNSNQVRIEYEKRKLYVLRCVRGGIFYYVTGQRADEGKWSKKKSRATTFTAEEAKTAKGKSHAQIIPL